MLEIVEGISGSGPDGSEIAGSITRLPEVKCNVLPAGESGGGAGGEKGDPVELLVRALRHPGEKSRWVTLESIPPPAQFPDQTKFERLVEGMGDRSFKKRIACYQSLVEASDDALPTVIKALWDREFQKPVSLEQSKRLESVFQMIVRSGFADPTAIEDSESRRTILERNANTLADPGRRERRLETLRRIGLLYRQGLLPLDNDSKERLEMEYRLLNDPNQLSLRFSRERLELARLIIGSSDKRDEVFRLLLDSVESSPEIIEDPRFARLVQAADLATSFEKLLGNQSRLRQRITDKSLTEFRRCLDYTGNEVRDEGRRGDATVADP